MTTDRNERDASAGEREQEQEQMRQSAAAGAPAQQTSGTSRDTRDTRTRDREQPMRTAREGGEARARGSSEDNARIAETVLDLWNNRDLDEIMRLATEDAECVQVPFDATYSGPAGFRALMQGWLTAFPDGRAEVRRVIADENGAVIEYIGRGTQTGPLTGPAGTIPATGQPAELRLCDVLEIEQGRVRRVRSYFDSATLMRQLGVSAQTGAGGSTTASGTSTTQG